MLTREPGGTVIGARVRELVLDPATERLDPRAEALLMAADRAQHVAEVVEPALAAGRHVVTDRFAGSSIAYQGHGRGLPVDEIEGLSQLGDRRACGPTWSSCSTCLRPRPTRRLGAHARTAWRPSRRRSTPRWRVGSGPRPRPTRSGGRSSTAPAPIDEVAAAVRRVVAERLQLLG